MYQQVTVEHLFDDLLTTAAEASNAGHVILTGDFNARTGSQSDELDTSLAAHVDLPLNVHAYSYDAPARQSLDSTVDRFGLLLLQFCQASQLYILNGRIQGDVPGRFTSHANAGKSCIDYFIASPGICTRTQSLLVDDMLPHSDHFPVVLTLDMPSALTPTNTVVPSTPLLRYDMIRTEQFQAQFSDIELGQQLSGLHHVSAEAGFQILQDTIMAAATNTYEKVKASDKHSHHKPWFDQECKSALRSYRAALHDPSSHMARHFLKIYRAVVRRKKRRYTKHTAAKLADLAKHSPAKFWKRFRQKGNTTPIADLDKWMSHFEKLLNVSPNTDAVDSHLFDLHLPELPDALPLNVPISSDEVSAAITALKRHKAADLYGMRAEFVVDAAADLIAPITTVFNTAFHGDFPAAHSIGRLCPIFKSGNEHDPDNYRGITVSTVLSKLYATVLERRISSWAEDKGLRAAGQAGFRRDHRTSDNILILRTLIESSKALKTGKQHGRLYACFVDFRKAFDTIPREKLWQHLSSIGIQGNMLAALKAYYAEVQVCVDIPLVGRSPTFPSTIGVKQGCPMSPTLFGLYIDQLESHLMSHAQDAPDLQGQKVPVLLYADDIVLLSRSPADLQHLLHVLQLFCAEKLLSVNMSKTQIVVFNDFRHTPSESFMYCNQPLSVVDQYTYLGIVFHKSGSFKSAIQKLAAAGKRALFAMHQRCADLGIVDIVTRCSLFSSLVQPVLSYGCEIWGFEKGYLTSLMTIVHNMFMKRTLRVRRSVPDDVVLCELGQVPLYLHWHKLTLKYICRLTTLPDDRLVKKAFNQTQLLHTPWWQRVHAQICEYQLQGVFGFGSFNMCHAEQSLRDHWFRNLCQSSATKLSFYVDNMHFDSTDMAPYLMTVNSEGPLFDLIKFRLGSHMLRVETDRWVHPRPPREQRICQHCQCGAVEDEQHFLFDCPFYSIIRGQHFSLFEPALQHRDIRLFFEQNWDNMGLVARHLHVCFQARKHHVQSDGPELAPYPGL